LVSCHGGQDHPARRHGHYAACRQRGCQIPRTTSRPPLIHDDRVLMDYDFHPDESSVRIFRTPDRGVLRLDNQIVVTEALYDDVVLRHYAFADKWFKVNVSTDLAGNLVETGDAGQRFAFNCDIATPMERVATSTFGVDLFIDVLVRDDATSYMVGDRVEFEQAIELGLISRAEQQGARDGLQHLLELLERGRLLVWLHEIAPFAACRPPTSPPMERGPVPRRLQPKVRRTWASSPVS
jgi:predicted RNA-binding protein associated with RNAse of E/G family